MTVTQTPHLDELLLRRREILQIAERRGASNVAVFGSVARGDADAESDIDILVDLEPGRSLLDLGGLLMDLRAALGRDVDVVTRSGLRPRVLERVLATQRPYEARRERTEEMLGHAGRSWVSRAEAEDQAFLVAQELPELLDGIEAPATKRTTHLPEQLSFLHLRENFRVAVQLLEAGDDVSAALVVRALFEESIRWAWVDEDPEKRRLCFVVEARRAYSLISDAANSQGVEPAEYFGPMTELVLKGEAAGERFPPIEQMLNWSTPELGEMLYLQYRVLSQYTHSSLLAGVSALPAAWGASEHVRRLPRFTRLTILRNAVASAAMVTVNCRAGLHDGIGASPSFDIRAMQLAAGVAELLQDAAPGSG